MNDEEKKKKIEQEGHDADADVGDLDALEPAAGAAENAGPSEGEEFPEDDDGIARENITPDAPPSPEGDRS